MGNSNTEDLKKILKEILDAASPISDENAPATEDDIVSWNQALNVFNSNWAKRNELISKIFEFYVNERTDKENRKKYNRKRSVLFWTFLGMLIALTVGVVIGIVCVANKVIDVEAILALLSLGATYIGSIITILKVMTEYFFPIEEEKNTIAIITDIITSDLEQQKALKGDKDTK